ncbi:hypothetical protein NDU88_004943 [Pleurodeles waltl]|uniref:Uncharacterized protein n=1 Tax=Pleurodeles waltl TaxID=8319 RepID=A0AAV7RH33_PLEWA|nr:hypothetical protein NDU88_004943 [Pleurodeles waltl]
MEAVHVPILDFHFLSSFFRSPLVSPCFIFPQGNWYHLNGGMMGQIPVELRAIKLSQEEAPKETKDQLSQLNTHLIHLSTRVSQVEQRISDLEDVENEAE